MATHRNAVIFACDHNYIWPALLAANAIAAHATAKDFDIRIFSSTHVPDGFRERAAPGVSAEVLPMGDFTVKTGITDRYSMATFLRLFALNKIQGDYDRIAYFDADIAIRHGDVNVFWRADLGDRPAAAVRDWVNWGPVKPGNAAYMAGHGISAATGGYFNSGFLMVDAKRWQAEGINAQVFDYLDHKSDLCKYHDQSALNGVLRGRWAEVSPLWNWQTKVLHHILLIETRDPHMVHFNARRKPWRDRERLIHAGFKDDLAKLAADVGWNAFDDDYSLGPMRRRKELIRAEVMRDLYATLPDYVQAVSPYLNRTDFIDHPLPGPQPDPQSDDPSFASVSFDAD